MALPTLSVTPGAGATINTLPNAPQPTANSVAVALATDHAAVPVSASALPLPAGAASAANQAQELTALAAILAAIQTADAAFVVVSKSGAVHGTVSSASVSAGGTGYAVNDVVTLPGGANVTTPATLVVTAVSAGAITALSVQNGGDYSAAPANPVAPASTSGAGTGATVSLVFAALATQAAAANASRQYLAVRNESAAQALGLSLTGTASLGVAGTASFAPGGGGYEWAGARVPSNAASVIGQAAFQLFTIWEG
ncbi:hypothetical protein [Methylocella sp.]|uniref:hypothetical protein n=1 Tax=Methylocella sp. TaxID=1978226 RepID=UPI0037836A62